MITIYTAIFGNYDLLKEPIFLNPRIKYVCFTDKEYDSEIWDVRVVDIVESTPRREARKYKILSHKYIDTPVSLWIDGSRRIARNPLPFVSRALRTGKFFFAGKHPNRDCIYDEARRCIQVGKGDRKLISEQALKYLKEDYPEHNGLINSTVVLRRITPELIQLEKDWWYELKNGCCRDQVSFNYVAWKNNLNYGIIEWRKFVGGRGHNK